VLCAVVMATSRRSCPVVTTQMIGFLSSLTAVDSGVGIESCPWEIHVEPGRRVNITLYDFVDHTAPSTGVALPRGRPKASSSFNCEDWKIIIREGNQTTEVSLCLGITGVIGGAPSYVDMDQGTRERVVYTSQGGTMILIFLASATFSDTAFESTQLRSTPFLLRYNGLFRCLVTVCI